MALANRSLRFAFLTVGVFVFTACDRQATTEAPSQSTPAAAAPAPATESSGPAAIAAAVANPARPADDVAHDANRKPAETLTFFD